MSPKLKQQLRDRAGGVCECCGRPLYQETVDHFFGRARAKESLETCWLLRLDCHRLKTQNEPSSKSWLKRFVAHCLKHGYGQTAMRAHSKMEWQKAMGVRT